MRIAPIHLSARQESFLHAAARKTWRYFEEFVTAQTHWLPPDNVQYNGQQMIAARTSPTNIVMGLLANLAASDFGYCSVGRLITRTQLAFDTLAKMERHRGHLLNWYDTSTLSPLAPQYVSTVDSGNFVGMLPVLQRGFEELIDTEIVPRRMLPAFGDTIGILRSEARTDSEAALVDSLQQALATIEAWDGSVSAILTFLPRLITLASHLKTAPQAGSEFCWWAVAIETDATAHLQDLEHLAGWTALPLPPDHLWLEASPGEDSAANRLRNALADLDSHPTLRTVFDLPATLLPLVALARLACSGSAEQITSAQEWLDRLQAAAETSAHHAAVRHNALIRLAATCSTLADVDFQFLYDTQRRLFTIGFNVTENRPDSGFYDLLASEARLASFVLIAKQQLEQSHWFALGRLLTSTGGAPTLLSWSGSMFEYLMPLLVMPTYDDTLLDRSCRAAVRRHITYGWRRAVPWGISESGYNARDKEMNYQYRAFGVPGLGLKRGLAGDLVIAPYASAMALMLEPQAACRNLQRLAAEGRLGTCGFYEAIDYTPSRQIPA
ncbi:MAG: glucoamylase family protein, partial [Planctomycetota bacterium]